MLNPVVFLSLLFAHGSGEAYNSDSVEDEALGEDNVHRAFDGTGKGREKIYSIQLQEQIYTDKMDYTTHTPLQKLYQWIKQ